MIRQKIVLAVKCHLYINFKVTMQHQLGFTENSLFICWATISFCFVVILMISLYEQFEHFWAKQWLINLDHVRTSLFFYIYKNTLHTYSYKSYICRFCIFNEGVHISHASCVASHLHLRLFSASCGTAGALPFWQFFRVCYLSISLLIPYCFAKKISAFNVLPCSCISRQQERRKTATFSASDRKSVV